MAKQRKLSKRLPKKKLGKVKWADMVPDKKENDFKDYSSSSSFYQGDLIHHFKFGRGFVQSSFGNKIEVLFEDKMRLLVHKVMF